MFFELISCSFDPDECNFSNSFFPRRKFEKLHSLSDSAIHLSVQYGVRFHANFYGPAEIRKWL